MVIDRIGQDGLELDETSLSVSLTMLLPPLSVRPTCSPFSHVLFLLLVPDIVDYVYSQAITSKWYVIYPRIPVSNSVMFRCCPDG